MLETYSKVSFIPLDIEEKKSMAYLIGLCDKANGFCFSITFLSNAIEKQIDYSSILEYMSFEATSEIQEKYIDLDNNDYEY